MNCARWECGAEARWHPVLHFRAPKEFEPCPAIPAILGLALCEACMGNAKLEDLVSPDLNELMSRVVQGIGLVKPDFTRTSLGRTPLTLEECQVPTLSRRQRKPGFPVGKNSDGEKKE